MSKAILFAVCGVTLLCCVCTQLLPAAQRVSQVIFSNVAAQAGIQFKHENGASPEKYMPETMGSGVVILDYDNDGWPDLFFVNGGSFTDPRVAANARHRLYRNNRDGTFSDVSATSGIGISGFGMGACSADYDNDGWPDLYITSFGGDRLYRNTGKGGFVDITEHAGVGSKLWSASCAFADVDNDGYVDLFVTRYVDFAINNNKYCRLTEDIRGYCHPNVYNGLSNLLYHNNGDGTFTDVTRDAGVYKIGNGLGVVFGDYDDDGWTDIYAANDSTPNFLFHNTGAGKFDEVGLWAGAAVSNDGKPLAGMGVDMGDINGDGRLDLFVTNLDGQTHSLYKNLGKGLFANATFESGIGEVTLPYVGFGTVFFDYDNDGDLDIAVANGDVLDNVSLLRDSSSYEQLNLLLQNDGNGKFKSVGPASGPGFAMRKASRGLAAGDLNNDGHMDIVITNVGDAPDLLQNHGSRANALVVRTIGSKSNRDGIGARLKLSVGGKTLVRHVKAGSSYLSQSDVRIHFGLGPATAADRLEIRWPSGIVDVLENIQANQIITVLEGKGMTDRRPFERK
jgi:hypothetical protein